MKHGYRIIDADGHILENHPEAIDWEKELPEPYKAWAPKHIPFPTRGGRVLMEGKLYARAALGSEGVRGMESFSAHTQRKGMWDPHARMPDMRAEGIDLSVLFGTVIFLGQNGLEDDGYADAICRVYNNWAHRYCQTYPDQLKAVALVRAREPRYAVPELERAVRDLGMVGALLTPHVGLLTPDNPCFHPLYEAAQALDVPVCVHGVSNLPGVEPFAWERYKSRHWVMTYGFPMELMLAVGSIVGGGVLDTFPRLRVAFLEGWSGWLPFWMERLDSWAHASPNEVKCKALPSEYLKGSQVYVSYEPEEETLAYTLERVGDDRILYASDYWHIESEFPGGAAKLIAREDITHQAKRKLLSENAARLYSL